MHDQQPFLRPLSDFARHLVTPYDVDDTLQELAEQTQLAQQEGPCVLACRSGKVVAIADLTQMTTGWDAYRAVAADLGIGAVAGVPMRLDGATIGALNLYARGPREWGEEDLAAVQVLADMCTGLLLNAAQLRQQQQLAEQLQGALDSRVVIEQAKGIIGHTHR